MKWVLLLYLSGSDSVQEKKREKKFTTTVAQWLDHRSRDREVLGSIPGRDRPKSLKLVVMASPLTLRIMGMALRLALQCLDNGLVNYWLK